MYDGCGDFATPSDICPISVVGWKIFSDRPRAYRGLVAEEKIQVPIRFEREVWEAIRREAKARGLSGAGLVRLIVQDWLRKEARRRKREERDA